MAIRTGIETLSAMIPEVLRAAAPGPLVRRALEDGHRTLGPCRVVAVGKASGAMVEAAVEMLGDRVRGAVVVGVADGGGGVPSLARGALSGGDGGGPTLTLGALWADHPVPSNRNFQAARRVREFVAGIPAAETLLVLLSGGASALLCLPREPLGLSDIARVTEALLRAGAPIEELNAVRKHCEVLKGGGLAACSGAGRIVTLVLSDVLGDRLDVIGSGPTAPDPTTFADALAVLETRGLLDVSAAVTALFRRGCAGDVPETVKPDDPIWTRVTNRIIGGNHLAIDAAVEVAQQAGYTVVERRECVEGEAAAVGWGLARAASKLAEAGRTRAAIVWGGETTVTVGAATGTGGRNQELALAAAIELDQVEGVTLLSFATDGRDGPTDAAGGIVDGTTAPALRAAGVDPNETLARHDSYNALDAVGALVRTGHTGTNINDLMVALVG